MTAERSFGDELVTPSHHSPDGATVAAMDDEFVHVDPSSFREHEMKLEARIAELETLYGEAQTRILELETEVERLRRYIEGLPQRR
jgi:hypothetical protein